MLERQFLRFRELAERAYGHSSFYRRLYDEAGTPPTILRHPEDIQRLPVIDKEMIRADSRRLVLDTMDVARLSNVVTSGTSGSPLTLYVDAAAAAAEVASIHHQWRRAGFRPGDGRVEFRGRVEGGGLTQNFPRDHVLRVDINRLGAEDLGDLLKAIQTAGHAFWHGYPSALARFAHLLETEGKTGELEHPKAILMASEMVLPNLLETLERVFPDTTLFAHYGQAERVALGAWTRNSRAYHFLPAYGMVEVDDQGRIIGSSLVNEVMPLLRYRTTDVASGFHAGSQASEPLFPVIETIEGRLEDQLTTPSGGFVSAARVTFPFKDGRCYEACKIVQHAADELELVMESSCADADLRREYETIVTQLRTVFGPAMRFRLTKVERIPRLPSGKFKWVESRI